MVLLVAVNSVAAVVVNAARCSNRIGSMRTPVIADYSLRGYGHNSRVTVIAVPIGRVTESNSYSSNPD